MELSTRLVNGITSGLTHVVRNGDPDQSYPGCVNLSFAFVEGESLLMALKDVALSSGRWVRVKAWIEKSPHGLLFVWNNSPFSHRPYPGYYSRLKRSWRQWLCQKNFFSRRGWGVVNKVHLVNMVNLIFESVHEIPWSDLLKKTSQAVLSLGTIYLVCILSLWMKPYGVTIQMKPVQQYFHMLLFI